MVKQVIVIRKDLKMRRGKEIAQGAHASMAFLSNLVRNYLDGLSGYPGTQDELILSKEQEAWIMGLFKKVVVKVHSEQELMDVAEKAKEKGLHCDVITDAGLTEFGGESTRTCLAIGPDEAHKIDEVTGHLELY